MKQIYLIAITLLFTGYAFTQKNIYVATNGNNTQPGSFTTPYKTIQYAINSALAYDTINIKAGSYNEKLDIGKSNIYIRSFASDNVVISGSGITSQVALVKITNRENVTLKRLEIANNIQKDAQGILVEGASKNITIDSCSIHDIHFSSNAGASVNSNTNAQGIIVYGTSGTVATSNILITNNKLYNCRLGYSEGIAVNGNVDGFTISNNHIYNLTNIGIDAIGFEGNAPANDQAKNGIIRHNLVHDCLSAYATSAGIYVDGGKDILIEQNTIYKCGYGIEIGCENKGKTTANITVRSNIIYNNEQAGIALGGWNYPSESGKVVTSSIINNTCFKNDYKKSFMGELYLSYSENCIIQNNILYPSDAKILCYAELGQPGMNFNYNLFYSDNNPATISAEWNNVYYNSLNTLFTATKTNQNSIVANPLFINTNISNPDFHIQSGSPAINKGNPLSNDSSLTITDIDWQLRYNDTVDCGADEFYNANKVYFFTGNGNWDINANWLNKTTPPSPLNAGEQIWINPIKNGHCILNKEQIVNNGASVIIHKNADLKISGDMILR